MLSKKYKNFLRSLDVDNNTLVCLALLDLIIIMLLVSRFVAPDLFRLGYMSQAESTVAIGVLVFACAALPLLLGGSAVYYGVKSFKDLRRHHHGKIDVKNWKHWVYFLTILFGASLFVKAILYLLSRAS